MLDGAGAGGGEKDTGASGQGQSVPVTSDREPVGLKILS